jgi:hypothetical protein
LCRRGEVFGCGFAIGVGGMGSATARGTG